MAKYIRKCSDEVAVMEVAEVGARAVAVEEAVDGSGTVKRRKVGNGDLRLRSSNGGGDVTTLENFVDSAEEEDSCDPGGEAASFSSGEFPASCCSSNGSMEKLKFADLEEERDEIQTVSRYNLDRSESTPTNEFTAESGEIESATTAKPPVIIDSRRTIPAEKMPPAAELEEFFANAEKKLHKQFKDKYNYDVVNDVPLKGRYKWIQLN